MMLSDVCLSGVCRVHRPKSRTERPRKTKIGTEVAHVTRDSDTTFKVRGQGHQAALLTAALASQAAAAVGVGTCWPWETLLHCRLLGGARRFGTHGGRRGAGAYRGGRPPTACWYMAVCIGFSSFPTFCYFGGPRNGANSDYRLGI